MERLKYAFQFISASFRLAGSHSDLRRTWLYTGVGGMVILLIGFIPLALVVSLVGLGPLGLILLGLIVVLIVICLLVWGEMVALLIAEAFDSAIQNADSHQPPVDPSQIIKRHWSDAAILALAIPGLLLINAITQVFGSSTENQPAWSSAHYLLVPVISLESRSLKDAIGRVRQIIEMRLLRFRSDLMQVGLVAWVVQWLFLVGGAMIGFLVAVKIVDPISASHGRLIAGTALGLMVSGVLILVGILFSTFTRTCYHTALFRWATNVEAARTTGDAGTALPPAILSRILGRSSRG